MSKEENKNKSDTELLDLVAEQLRRVSRDRTVVLSQHETFELIAEMRQHVETIRSNLQK